MWMYQSQNSRADFWQTSCAQRLPGCLVPFLIPSAVVFLKILKVLGSRNLLLVLHLRVLWWWFMGCMVVVYGMYGGGLWDVWWWFMGCGENLQDD
jgi:hypothetical protein